MVFSQPGWASSFDYRYMAIPEPYRGAGDIEPGYGSTPVAACRDYFTKNASEPPYTIEASAEGAWDTLADPFFVRGPACSGILGSNFPNERYAFEIYNHAGIDFFKNQGSDCSPVTNNGTNPVNIGIGNKFQRELDYESNPLIFKRTYSNTSRPLGLGGGWRGSFDRFIKNDAQYSQNSAYAYRENGVVLRFNLIAGNWKADTDIVDDLSELKDTSGVRTGWRFTIAADDSVETYSASGQLLSISDRAGRLQTLTYDLPLASGGDEDPETLDAVTDDTGRQLRFAYDANKLIATVTDPAGGIITYGYDAQSNLVSVQYPDGRSKTTTTTNPRTPLAPTCRTR